MHPLWVRRFFITPVNPNPVQVAANRATLLWLREQWVTLPDIDFRGIILTMPNAFWPVFKAHRHLQHDLPALGAGVIQQWAWSKHRVRLCVIVIQHTFGGHLNHNPHLHMMVSAGGLTPSQAHWVPSMNFDCEEIMSLWRHAVTDYLRKAHIDELLKKFNPSEDFVEVTGLWGSTASRSGRFDNESCRF